MKNIKEALSNVFVVGGLVTAGGSAVDMVSTIHQEAQQTQAIIDEMRSKFHVRQECEFAGVPGSVVCSEKVIDEQIPMEAERTLQAFKRELSERRKQTPPDHTAQKRLARDIVGMTFGGAVSMVAKNHQRRRK